MVRRGDVRRAKLYYLRDLRGKAAKIKERRGANNEFIVEETPVVVKTPVAEAPVVESAPVVEEVIEAPVAEVVAEATPETTPEA